MSTYTARPGTPFPHASTLSHSPSSSARRYSNQSLHFVVPTLPARTPPSLLKRSASASSSSSASPSSSAGTSPRLVPSPIHYTRSPAAGPSASAYAHAYASLRRESTTSSTSTASPIMPATPTLVGAGDDADIEIFDAGEPITPPPTPYDPSLYPPQFAGAAAKRAQAHAQAQAQPQRPKLKRRDTPRPAVTIQSMAMLARDEAQWDGRKRFTSVVDGGSWIVVA